MSMFLAIGRLKRTVTCHLSPDLGKFLPIGGFNADPANAAPWSSCRHPARSRAMTEAQISEALEAAARAGDAKAKAFLRTWYSHQSATKTAQAASAPVAAPAASR